MSTSAPRFLWTLALFAVLVVVGTVGSMGLEGRPFGEALYTCLTHVIEGDATHDQILIDAGLAEAAGLITCLSADTDNLFVCLSARDGLGALRPTVVSFVDIANRASDLALRIEQTSVTKNSRLAGRTLAEARIPQETGLIVIAIGKQGDARLEFLFDPSAETRREPGDEVIALGETDQVERLRSYLEGASVRPRPARAAS